MKVLGIVGSYRRGGTIDAAVDVILEAAQGAGADTVKLYLIDQHIEFCTNCRTCMQQGGEARGVCIHHDDMPGLLEQIAAADALVLGSPMNFGTVTAVTKRFMERLACMGYWPWGAVAPKFRITRPAKVAVVVASAAAPAFIARLQSDMVTLMKKALRVLGAKTIGVLFIGMAATEPHQPLTPRACAKARRLGILLARSSE